MTVGNACLFCGLLLITSIAVLRRHRSKFLNDDKKLAAVMTVIGIFIGILVAFLCADNFQTIIQLKPQSIGQSHQ
jgi:hypothetical protein